MGFFKTFLGWLILIIHYSFISTFFLIIFFFHLTHMHSFYPPPMFYYKWSTTSYSNSQNNLQFKKLLKTRKSKISTITIFYFSSKSLLF
jgi:hypothetical protein